MTIVRSFEYAIRDRDVWYVRFEVDPKRKFVVLGRDGASSRSVGDVYVYLISAPRTETEQVQPQQLISTHLRGLLRDITFSPDAKYMVVSSDSGYVAVMAAGELGK